MKKIFSTSWKSSKQPRKQRKYLAGAPAHLRQRFLAANLSKELRKKYGRRSIPLRKGDVVKIMRGKFKKKTGNVTAINRKRLKVEIEGLQVKKADGSKANIKFDPSLLQITELNAEDKKRGVAVKAIKAKTVKTEEKTGEEKNAS